MKKSTPSDFYKDIGAIFYFIFNGFRKKISFYKDKKYNNRNFVTGVLVALIAISLLFYLLIVMDIINIQKDMWMLK